MHAIWQWTLNLCLTPSLLTLFLTWCKISQCKQWVYCVQADLVCPWCWLFCLWESPRWIESPSCVQADVSTHSPSLCFDNLQTIAVFGLVCRSSSSSPLSKASKCSDKEQNVVFYTKGVLMQFCHDDRHVQWNTFVTKNILSTFSSDKRSPCKVTSPPV